jgi:beta-alanine--pyruvate transaminase
VDSALKLALLWHRLRGEGTRTRFIGRERGYHGVGFGTGIGGIGPNRKAFGALTTFADHLPHTHLPENAFSRGLPPHGAHLADALERLVTLHDASTIAAVVVEPMAGSTGVLLPPVGYLERLRAITEKHGILLVFDEVITGFGRLGDGAFGANVFGVTPDLITFAKGVTNGTVPMGGVLLRRPMADALLAQPPGIEWPHGYTYSGHPLACAAALATLELYRAEALFSRGAALAPTLGALVHGLKGTRHVVDVRHLGLAAAVELEPRPGAPGARGFDVFLRCWERGVLVRQTGDIIALAPPLVSEPAHLEQLVTVLAGALRDVA